jgi:hypothetical protein
MITIVIIAIFIITTHLIAEHIGKKRKIGYNQSVFWSILFSPIVGLIVTLFSKRIDPQ